MPHGRRQRRPAGPGSEFASADRERTRRWSSRCAIQAGRLAWGLTEPTKEFPQEYESVTAMTSDGKEIKGVTLNEDSFSVQIMDMNEQIHLLEKDGLRSFQKTRQSAMPVYKPDHVER